PSPTRDGRRGARPEARADGRSRCPGCPADREGIEADLVREAADVAGLEARSYEQRPEVAHVVVHLVVVHLGRRREAELEGRELEVRLAAPRWNVDEAC